jgi:hypothetical protein
MVLPFVMFVGQEIVVVQTSNVLQNAARNNQSPQRHQHKPAIAMITTHGCVCSVMSARMDASVLTVLLNVA